MSAPSWRAGRFGFAGENEFDLTSDREEDVMQLISAEWLYEQFSAFLSGIRIEENSMDKHPTEEEIQQRAYELFLERGGEHGRHVDDWLQAERELQDTYASLPESGKAAASG